MNVSVNLDHYFGRLLYIFSVLIICFTLTFPEEEPLNMWFQVDLDLFLLFSQFFNLSFLLYFTHLCNCSQVVASRLRSNQRAWEALKQCPLTKSLVEAARTHPRLAANACCLFRNSQNEHESPKMKSR